MQRKESLCAGSYYKPVVQEKKWKKSPHSLDLYSSHSLYFGQNLNQLEATTRLLTTMRFCKNIFATLFAVTVLATSHTVRAANVSSLLRRASSSRDIIFWLLWQFDSIRVSHTPIFQPIMSLHRASDFPIPSAANSKRARSARETLKFLSSKEKCGNQARDARARGLQVGCSKAKTTVIFAANHIGLTEKVIHAHQEQSRMSVARRAKMPTALALTSPISCTNQAKTKRALLTPAICLKLTR